MNQKKYVINWIDIEDDNTGRSEVVEGPNMLEALNAFEGYRGRIASAEVVSCLLTTEGASPPY